MGVQFIRTEGGEELAILSRAEFEELRAAAEGRDAADHEAALSDLREGRAEALGLDEMNALLDARTPLLFWRNRRGLTQAALAREAGTSQPYLAEIEKGSKTGSLGVVLKLAWVLGVSAEQLA